MEAEGYGRYENYKESEEDWIGKVPSHWEVAAVKAVLEERIERNSPLKTSDILSLCMYRGVIPYAEKGASGNKAKDDLTAYRLAYPGDIVLNSMNVIAGSVGLSKYFGAVSPVYYMLRPRKQEDRVEYFNAIFQNEAFQKSLTGLGNGILIKKSESSGKLNTIRMKIPMMKLNKVLLPRPPEKEQLAILNFLDKKTAQIDEAIAIKEQQIALLKERKQIVFQQAVTRGLDPNVLMKDSGVEWIGEIPVGWSFSELKRFVDILPGFAFKSESYSAKESDIRLLRGVNVAPGKTKWDEVVYWPKEKLRGLERYHLAEGDLVIAMDRPWISTGIRVAELTKGDLPSMLLQRVGKITGKSGLLTPYVKLLLSTNLFRSYFEPMLTGISVPHISSDQIEGFLCPLPPQREQVKIMEFLAEKEREHSTALEITHEQIEKLKEYKTTLINSAVTGKIKVT